jgi:hypothetical protein
MVLPTKKGAAEADAVEGDRGACEAGPEGARGDAGRRADRDERARRRASGLSTGGSGATGYLDVANFCCPEYLSTMIQLIQRNWNGKQNVLGITRIKYTISVTAG